MKKVIRLLVFMMVAGFLVSCGTTSTFTFQCAFVTGRGISDTYGIKQVLLPGEKVTRDADDEDWFVPCNSRNYIMDKDGNGDTTTTIIARTAPDEGQTLGTLVQIELSTYWELNQLPPTDGLGANGSDRVDWPLAQFFEYCQKFACADSAPTSFEAQLASNNSSVGWNEMLSETWPSALDRAGQQAMPQFTDDIVDQPNRWQEIAEFMQPLFMEQLAAITGTTGSDSLFCASGSKETGTCQPITIVIDAINIWDPDVLENRNQEARRAADLELQLKRLADERTLFEQESLLENERAAQVAALYATPGYAEERRYQAQLELVQACAEAAQKCVIMIGGDDQQDVQVQVPVE